MIQLFKLLKWNYGINEITFNMPFSEIITFPCDRCDYRGTTKSNLLAHVKTKHQGIKYPCNKCDYMAAEKSSLVRHKKSTHEGIKK